MGTGSLGNTPSTPVPPTPPHTQQEPAAHLPQATHSRDSSPGVHLPQLLAHAVIPHRHQPFLSPTDNLPVIHLDCGHPQLMGRQ